MDPESAADEITDAIAPRACARARPEKDFAAERAAQAAPQQGAPDDGASR